MYIDLIINNSNVFAFFLVSFMINVFILPLYFVSFEFSYVLTKNDYERTELGKEIKQKLNG